MESKVSVKISAIAAGAGLPPVFAPQAVPASAVFITIRIGHRQDVKVQVVNEVAIFLAVDELIDHKRASCVRNPFPSMNA